MNRDWKLIEVTGSTNTDLIEAGKQGAPHGTGLAARRQTAGRGRRGHTWDSTEGNLLLSVILRPNVASTQLTGLAAVCGLAIAHELKQLDYDYGVTLKWPNDLTINDRKLGGVLVEAAIDKNGDRFAVCGIAINIAYAPSVVGDNGLTPICLKDLNDNVPELETLIDRVYSSVMEYSNRWAAELNQNGPDTPPLAPVIDEYRASVSWIGKPVRVVSPKGEEIEHGVFETVDEQGRAVIQTSQGMHAFHLEQASLRL